MPLTTGNSSRQIGRCSIRLTDSEVAFVAATGSAKPLGIGDTQVQDGALLLARKLEIDTDATNAGGHGEGNLNIGLILRT